MLGNEDLAMKTSLVTGNITYRVKIYYWNRSVVARYLRLTSLRRKPPRRVTSSLACNTSARAPMSWSSLKRREKCSSSGNVGRSVSSPNKRSTAALSRVGLATSLTIHQLSLVLCMKFRWGALHSTSYGCSQNAYWCAGYVHATVHLSLYRFPKDGAECLLHSSKTKSTAALRENLYRLENVDINRLLGTIK